jgi:hypothetical protein
MLVHRSASRRVDSDQQPEAEPIPGPIALYERTLFPDDPFWKFGEGCVESHQEIEEIISRMIKQLAEFER